MQTLKIQDLSASRELDSEAMEAVQGGQSDQANGTSQANVQNMGAAANIGNGSLFSGPATISSDNTFTQDASNYNEAWNVKGLDIGYPWYGPEVLR
ncbi:MAG TPA: hypothetical protein VN680_13740 [Burkholderiaceae bacterium]|jgi:hypothetical protein|nr:hypothetical protein [Burkholderiaceae bacterium]